jgi:hypothetical protein
MRPGCAIVNDNLLGGIEETRDALNLPSGDPTWDVHAALKGEHDDHEADAERERVAEEASVLRGSLRTASSRLDDLERQLAAKQAELDVGRSSAHAATTPASDPEERERVRELRNKVGELKGLVREGNTERSELRRQLAATSSTARVQEVLPVAVSTIDDVDDERGCEPIATIDRGVTFPNLSRRAQDALDQAPAQVASLALRMIGALGAGDANVWRGVKQAKDMPRQVLMARIGIHNRLLFRVEDRRLEVLELVTRESLMTTLRRMR